MYRLFEFLFMLLSLQHCNFNTLNAVNIYVSRKTVHNQNILEYEKKINSRFPFYTWTLSSNTGSLTFLFKNLKQI